MTINSGNADEWDDVEDALAADAIDVLLISPERLANERLHDGRPAERSRARSACFVIDEAHCISDWGHDFRPDYRRIGRILPLLGPIVPVLATTATANDRVVARRRRAARASGVRGHSRARSRATRCGSMRSPSPTRPSGSPGSPSTCPRLPGSGIVYCLTVADTQRVATLAAARRASMPGPTTRPRRRAEREALEDALIANEMKALVATVALGMGFDKPDLGFVVHYQRPGSAIAYYQQVGRAGPRRRARLRRSSCRAARTTTSPNTSCETAFPPTVHMHEILAALEGVDSMSKSATPAGGQPADGPDRPGAQAARARRRRRARRRVDTSARRIRGSQDEERIERVTGGPSRSSSAQMQAYMRHDGCLMEFLTRLLDDPTAAPCGRCSNDVGRGLPREVDA